MWECEICPDGFYCLPENVTAGDPTSGYHDCPPGYYCPSGTGLDWQPCPRGTYSMMTNLFRVNYVLPLPEISLQLFSSNIMSDRRTSALIATEDFTVM